MSKDTLNSNGSLPENQTDAFSPENGKLKWVKPELHKIEAGSDTDAAKPNNVPFESTPTWGIS